MERTRLQYVEATEAEKRQWEFKQKSIEEKCRSLMSLKNDMENEIRHLNENIMKIKIEADEQMRERIVRIQEEEYK